MDKQHSRKRLKDYESASIRNKLLVHEILECNPDVRKHLLDTKPLTENSLINFISKYPLNYVKPAFGSRGIGIFQIRSSSDQYTVRTIKEKRTFDDPKDVYMYIISSTNKSMIIQQGITLQRVVKRPYDIRVMVQRKPNRPWICTGLFCKVGKPDKIVTNVFQGGELWTTKKIFTKQALPKEIKYSRIRNLKTVSRKVAKTLSRHQSGMHQMGIDMAFDTDDKLWILEVNSHHPAFYPLKKLNKSMFNKMMRFAKSYGRNKP